MRRPLARTAVAILFSALLVVGAVLPAAADYSGPTVRESWVDPGGTFIGMCTFPVQMTIDQLGETSTVWERPDGSFVWHLTGVSKSTWTNLNTGYSVTRNLSGPLLWTFYPDGSQYRHFPGPQAMNDSPEGPYLIWFIYGSLKVWIGSDDWSAALHGRMVEICDLLNH